MYLMCCVTVCTFHRVRNIVPTLDDHSSVAPGRQHTSRLPRLRYSSLDRSQSPLVVVWRVRSVRPRCAQVEEGRRGVSVPVRAAERDAGRAARGGAGRGHGAVGAGHVAGRQRAVHAAAAAGGAAARGLGAALVHGAGRAAGQRGHAGLRHAAPPAAAAQRRRLHPRPAHHRRPGALAERLRVRADLAGRPLGPLRRLPDAHLLRGAGRLHVVGALLPVPAALPRRVPGHVPRGRGAQRAHPEHPRAGPGHRRRAGVPALGGQLDAGGAPAAAAVRYHRVPGAARRACGAQPAGVQCHQLLPRVRLGARGGGGGGQGRGGERAAGGARVVALAGRASADGGAERAQQRRVAVRAVVLLHAVRRARLPPGRVAGRRGDAGRVPGGRVAAARGAAHAGRAAAAGRRAARAHPGHRAAQPAPAAAALRRRGGARGVVVGGGERVRVVRAHVGVRVGACGRRARHAGVRRLHAAGLGRRLAGAVPARQLHAGLHAGAGLPCARAQLGPHTTEQPYRAAWRTG